MERWKIDETTLITVGADASSVIGTSAELLEGDTLTIWQLLYGLMLPSGNDAAHQLAEYFGAILKKHVDESEEKIRTEEKERAREEDEKQRSTQDFKDKMM